MIGRVVRRVSSSIFVGRVPERARLVAGLDAASSGEPGLILLGGEAGIGKTRLVDEFMSIARAEGALAVRGGCFDVTTGTLPFAPVVELVRDLERRTSEAELETILGSERPWLAVLDPHLGEPDAINATPTARVTPTDSLQLRLFRAFADVLVRAAADRTTVVVIEDIHWADASTLDLLRFLTRGLISERLLVVLTFRSDELHRRHPLVPFLGELGRLAHSERLEIPRFGRSEVADQLSGILGGGPPLDGLVDRVSDRSDGNPFFVEELVAASHEGRFPGSLREVLAVRIGALSAEARAVVGVAAAHAERSAIAFRHALVQELAYSELVPPERIALHAAIASALEDGDAPPGEVAHHAYLAHDLPLALARSAQAAERATEAFAFAEALGHLERALELWDRVAEPGSLTSRDRAGLLLDAARCAAAIAESGRARDLARMALALLPPATRRDERIGALLELYWYEMFAGNHSVQRDMAYEAAALVPADPATALRATVLTNLSMVAEMDGREVDARTLAEEALHVARRAGARREEAAASIRLAKVVGASFCEPEAAGALVVRAFEIADKHGGFPDDMPISVAVFVRAEAAVLSGRFEDAIVFVDDAIDAAERLGRSGHHGIKIQKCDALTELGRWAEAEAMLGDIRRGPMPLAARQADGMLAALLARRGRSAEAAEIIGPIDPSVPPGERQWLLFAEARLAAARRRLGETPGPHHPPIGVFPDPLHESGLLPAMEEAVRVEADRAEAARRRRQRREAEEARDMGLARLELLRRIAAPAIESGGAGRLIEAIVATAEAEGTRLQKRPDPELWKTAADRREALRQPWETAYCLLRHAEAALAARALRHEAAESLRKAHTIATKLDAPPLVGEIEGLARRARIELGMAEPPARPGTSRPTTDGGVAVALTSREREVLSLVAAGHTNREIGEQLFISDKTASVHVTNAMDKLGALSRYEAASLASGLGLLEDATGTPAREGDRLAN